MMFGLGIDVVFFNFLSGEAARYCPVANLNSQMGDGQERPASILLGHFLRMAN